MTNSDFSLFGKLPIAFSKSPKDTLVGYSITKSPLGQLMIAATKHGVCFLSLGEDKFLVAELRKQFPQAQLVVNEFVLDKWIQIVTAYLEGQITHPHLPLNVLGSPPQLQVWRELIRIPAGSTRTYSELAEIIFKKASARRWVGQCCATNPVSLVIPCHRVIRSDGGLGGYRWGISRKKALIDLECERQSTAES